MPSILELLEENVRQEFGANTLATVRAVGAERQSGNGALPRAFAFIAALAEVRRRPLTDTCAHLARQLVKPAFGEITFIPRRYTSTRAILLQINAVGTDLFALLYPGHSAPYVDVELQGADSMRLTVSGASEMAAFLEGLILGISDYFEERVTVRRLPAPVGGAARHLMDVVFEGERRAGTGTPPLPGAERRAGVLGGVNTFLK